MIGKTYSTEHGMPVRVVAMHTFEGVEYAFAEALRIGNVRCQADMTAVVASTLTPIDASVFDDAVTKTRKHVADKAKKEAARDDAQRYGITVAVTYRSTPGTATIVRCTATRWVASDGSAYARKQGYRNGYRIGRGSWDWQSIDVAGLKALADFVGDRERVDIVAERKAAALRETGEVTP